VKESLLDLKQHMGYIDDIEPYLARFVASTYSCAI